MRVCELVGVHRDGHLAVIPGEQGSDMDGSRFAGILAAENRGERFGFGEVDGQPGPRSDSRVDESHCPGEVAHD